jgi:pre-mRNA-processing factor 19
MSISKCALSGKIIENPVVSILTGHVFEKDDIENHIDQTGQCPITGNPISKTQLIEINKSDFSKPNTIQKTMPTVVGKLQEEWDTVILENFMIKKQLKDIKQELSKTLYQHEAASLVICRLIREKDEAVKQLNSYKAQIEQLRVEEENDEGEEFDYMGIYDELIDRMTESFKNLSAGRKKRFIPELKDPSTLKLKGSFPIHSASKPGITTLAIHPIIDNLIVTGGVDGKVVLFDGEHDKIITSAEGHTKRVNDVEFYPSEDLIAFLSCAADNTASFWIHNEKLTEKYRITNHTNQITSVSFHPLKEYALVGSKDSYWSFHNLFKGVCLIKQKTEAEINTCQIHPDGKFY